MGLGNGVQKSIAQVDADVEQLVEILRNTPFAIRGNTPSGLVARRRIRLIE